MLRTIGLLFSLTLLTDPLLGQAIKGTMTSMDVASFNNTWATNYDDGQHDAGSPAGGGGGVDDESGGIAYLPNATSRAAVPGAFAKDSHFNLAGHPFIPSRLDHMIAGDDPSGEISGGIKLRTFNSDFNYDGIPDHLDAFGEVHATSSSVITVTTVGTSFGYLRQIYLDNAGDIKDTLEAGIIGWEIQSAGPDASLWFEWDDGTSQWEKYENGVLTGYVAWPSQGAGNATATGGAAPVGSTIQTVAHVSLKCRNWAPGKDWATHDSLYTVHVGVQH